MSIIDTLTEKIEWNHEILKTREGRKSQEDSQEDRMIWSVDISLPLSGLPKCWHNWHMNGVVIVAEIETMHKPNSIAANKCRPALLSRRSIGLLMSSSLIGSFLLWKDQ